MQHTFRDPVKNFTFETVIAFMGALLVIPLVIKFLTAMLRGLFKLAFFRRLLVDTAIVGATALLTREDVLDRIFGRRNGHSVPQPQRRRMPAGQAR